MKLANKLILAASAFALAQTASAQTEIFIAGSNGDRAATNTAIGNLLQGETFYGTNANPTRANFGVFKGGTFNDQPVTVYVSYIGATGGIKAVAGSQPVKFVPADVSQNPVTDPTGTGAANQTHVPDFGMSTNFQSSSLYLGTYQGEQYEKLNDVKIGVVALKWLASPGFPTSAADPANLTSQQVEALYTAGVQPLALFTGLNADQKKLVYAIGRNTDAGQRYIALAEPKVGGSNITALNAVVKQWQITSISGQTTVNGTQVGGTVSAQRLWPRETVSGVDSQYDGNSGFPTGATLAPALTATLGAGAYQLNGDTSITGGYYIGYLTPSDADSIAIPNGAVELRYNGVQYSPEAVREGRYTSWVYSHLLYRDSLAQDTLRKSFADTLANQVKTQDAVAGGGILIDTMKVKRSSEGGNILPLYF